MEWGIVWSFSRTPLHTRVSKRCMQCASSAAVLFPLRLVCHVFASAIPRQCKCQYSMIAPPRFLDTSPMHYTARTEMTARLSCQPMMCTSCAVSVHFIRNRLRFICLCCKLTFSFASRYHARLVEDTGNEKRRQ